MLSVIRSGNMNFIWPHKLTSPHVDLGSPISEALGILKGVGTLKLVENKKENEYRVSSSSLGVAVYETNGLVSSVWYNDPLGRLWPKGKALKINLYLSRYGSLENWEPRLNNGWIQFYFNDVLGINMAYGLQKDVIRFNKQSV